MSLAIVASQTLVGSAAHFVQVEVHVAAGLPCFHIVGLPDTGVRESRDRVRAALASSGFIFPAGRVTVNLAPADLPKASGRFDLPIALGILLASGQLVANPSPRTHSLSRMVFAGELSLTGVILPVRAPLLLALGVAQSMPGAVLVLPEPDAALAAHVSGIQVLAADTLSHVVEHIAGSRCLARACAKALPQPTRQQACMADVMGQPAARRVLEVAASGGHSLLFRGPPGTGKSMLAHRLPGLLPDLDPSQQLQVAAIASLCNEHPPKLCKHAPFRAPHHSISVAALVGGGHRPRPGEITRAHHGVLFLDELPQFSRAAINALREPLETGSITIARARLTAVFDARFQLVAAMNPCPCGWLGHPVRSCACTPDQLARYLQRISGPFLDRLDLVCHVPAMDDGWTQAAQGEASATIRVRVQACRQRQLARQRCLNAVLSTHLLATHARPDAAGQAMLNQVVRHRGWSVRAVHRALRVARTLADMAASDKVCGHHIAEAIQYGQREAVWTNSGKN